MRPDRLVQFYRATLSEGAFGMTEEWQAHGVPVWAHKKDVSDAERWRAGEVAASVTTRFTVRWSPFTNDIRPTDRLECEGRLFEIVGVKEGEGRRQWIELTTSARTDLR